MTKKTLNNLKASPMVILIIFIGSFELEDSYTPQCGDLIYLGIVIILALLALKFVRTIDWSVYDFKSENINDLDV